MANRLLISVNGKTGLYGVTGMQDKDVYEKSVKVYSFTGKSDIIIVDITLPSVNFLSQEIRNLSITCKLAQYITSNYKKTSSKANGVLIHYANLSSWVEDNFVRELEYSYGSS